MKDQKAEILRLKREGKGYKTISCLTGVNLNTVKTTCRRSGLFRDNPEHRVLFTIPEKKYSTAVAVPKPLPPQRTITGDKQTDAYLWVLEVIKTGEPAHIAAVEDTLKKLTISPKQAQENYTRHLQAQGAGWTSVFSTMWMDNPQHYIDQAKAQYEKAGAMRGVFGSLEAVFKPVEAERRIEEVYGAYQEIYCDYMAEGPGEFSFTDVLPEPYTLSDVVREIQYWDWLSSMRNGAFRELYPSEYPNENGHLWDREQYLDHLLETIRPLTRIEALDVLKWCLKYPRYQDMNADSDGVYLNLIGMHEVA
ncbi:hypothetical protein OM409_12455 [Serratia bockelmannii]|uniref:hypothetical protein n=1 Tax=Serratia bockelmannii TaxID=2703793 RepID=UPI00223EBBFE|nr:hypothetical protein [Serratia bockelmannii]BEN05094.1 hypothetical protein SMETH9_04200 [Serratia marcescens]MCW7646178.1 hypothetical protein [Serratia bockelmannii]MCW7655963.1 hypothetical protein [Serratia bockelmannii]MCW7675748.1 hypothetical protein [Serratia bockelmannii]MCW7680526.1 hypothetical protein [Serratia bockelmannii]